MATASSCGGAGGAVVVQRAPRVHPVLLLFCGYGYGTGLGWRWASLYCLLGRGALRAVASGSWFDALPLGPGGPPEAAAQLCCARHGLHTQPKTHRAAADWRNCGSIAVSLRWLRTGHLWDYAALSQPVRHAFFWGGSPGHWGHCGAGCDGVWGGGLCAGKEKHKDAKKKTEDESLYSDGVEEQTVEGFSLKSVKFVVSKRKCERTHRHNRGIKVCENSILHFLFLLRI